MVWLSIDFYRRVYSGPNCQMGGGPVAWLSLSGISGSLLHCVDIVWDPARVGRGTMKWCCLLKTCLGGLFWAEDCVYVG